MRLNSTSFPSLLDICRTLFFASQLALKFNKPDLNDQNGKVLFSTHQSGFTQHLTSFDGSHTQSKHALKYAWISITIGYLLGSHVAIIWVVIHKKWSAFWKKILHIFTMLKTCQGSPRSPRLPRFEGQQISILQGQLPGSLYQHLSRRLCQFWYI